MKKFLLTILLCFCIATYLQADNLIFHIGGGLSSHYGGSTRNIGAFRIGMGYDIRLPQSWSIEPAAYFYAKGWKDKNKEVPMYDEDGNLVYDDNGNLITGVMNVTSNTNYLEIPILVHYHLTLPSEHIMTFSAGPYAAYGIGGNSKTSGDTEQSGADRFYHSHSTFSQDNVHRFDAGITAGISYCFTESIEAGFSCDFGLTNVKREGSKNVSAIITLSYRF